MRILLHSPFKDPAWGNINQKQKINWRKHKITKNNGSTHTAKHRNVDDNIGVGKVK